MKAIIALLLGVASATPSWMKEFTLDDLNKIDTLQVFQQWVDAFGCGKKEAEKYITWLDNLHTIATYNPKDLSYKLRLNQFGDMTPGEFKQYIHGDLGSCIKPLKKDKPYVIGGDDGSFYHPPVNAPASVDWTTKGVFAPVKNQGQCGSCWSVSTTGSLGCDYAIKTGTLNILSEQPLVDCAPITDECLGCNGGQTDGAFKYVEKNDGLCSETEYTAKNGQCKASSCAILVQWTKGFNIPGVAGKDIAGLMNDAFQRYDIPACVGAICNDTEQDIDQVVNMEWGNFDQKQQYLNKVPETDVFMDQYTPNKEKILSGLFCGEVIRLIINQIFSDKMPKGNSILLDKFVDFGRLSVTRLMRKYYNNNSYYGTMKILETLHGDRYNLKLFNHSDVPVLVDIFKMILWCCFMCCCFE